jgi:hypothetical protein
MEPSMDNDTTAADTSGDAATAAGEARHAAKMRRIKAARDAMLAAKTDAKGLLIVHTEPGRASPRPLSAWSSGISRMACRLPWCSSPNRRIG